MSWSKASKGGLLSSVNAVFVFKGGRHPVLLHEKEGNFDFIPFFFPFWTFFGDVIVRYLWMYVSVRIMFSPIPISFILYLWMWRKQRKTRKTRSSSKKFPFCFLHFQITLFEKSNFCPKIQFWQNPNIFTSFSPQFFLTIFLVKSKLSTAKKSKTTTFSRVFHPKKSTFFSGNRNWIFGQKMKISNSV